MKGGGTIESINLSRSNDDENSDVNFSGQVHQPPCCIKCDGPCAVSDYFRPKPTGTEVVGIRVEKAHFSTRKLHGVTVPLSSGYSGLFLGKKNLSKGKVGKVSDMYEENSNSWEMKVEFNKLTYWNHDTYPSKDDVIFAFFPLVCR